MFILFILTVLNLKRMFQIKNKVLKTYFMESYNFLLFMECKNTVKYKQRFHQHSICLIHDYLLSYYEVTETFGN